MCVVYSHIKVILFYPGYLKVNSSLSEVGYSYVNCSGHEERLEECTIGNLTSHNCSQVAVILQCLNGNIHMYIDSWNKHIRVWPGYNPIVYLLITTSLLLPDILATI